MNPLGRGLESLIPEQNKEENTANRLLAEDILSFQENLPEASHSIHFASETIFPATPPPSSAEEKTFLPSQPKPVFDPASKIAEPDFYPHTQKTPTFTETNDISEISSEGEPHPLGLGVGVYREEKLRTEPSKTGESVFWIEVEKIEPNPFQPRREFDEEALRSLADSIKNYGVLQPLLVTKIEEETPRGLSVRYQLIAGERRWRAARLAGMREVPVIIKKDKIHDRLKLEMALIENVQREDLNPVERAVAFKQLVDDFRMTQREISRKIGKSREYVTNTLRLLTLPEEAKTLIRQNQISEGHGRALLMLSDHKEKQWELLEDIKRNKINVRNAELAARALIGHRYTPQRRDVGKLELMDREWQKQLEDFLGTRVSLVKLDGGKGKIVVEFYSDEEFHNIIDKMIREV